MADCNSTADRNKENDLSKLWKTIWEVGLLLGIIVLLF